MTDQRIDVACKSDNLAPGSGERRHIDLGPGVDIPGSNAIACESGDDTPHRDVFLSSPEIGYEVNKKLAMLLLDNSLDLGDAQEGSMDPSEPSRSRGFASRVGYRTPSPSNMQALLEHRRFFATLGR